MIVTLAAPVEIIKVPEEKLTLSSITVERMADIPARKTVLVFLKELPNKPVVLWKDAAYDAIGQWTDADVIARLQVPGVVA
jgi:hypothetical protein